MGYFDLMFFVLQYSAKHGIPATLDVVRPFVSLGKTVKVENVPEHKFKALAEELVRRY